MNLRIFSAIVAGTICGAVQAAEPPHCLKPESYPVAVLAATREDVQTADPRTLPDNLVESFLFCVQESLNPPRAVSFEFIQIDPGTAKAKTPTLADFKRNGYQVSRDFPIYGNVELIDIQCKHCDWAQKTQTMNARILHKFSVFRGKRGSDYRTVQMQLVANPVTGRIEIHHRGQPIHAIVFEAGTFGIEKFRASSCPPGRIDPCLAGVKPSELRTEGVYSF